MEEPSAQADNPGDGPGARGRVVMALIASGVAIVAMLALMALYGAVLWARAPAVGQLAESGDPGATAFMAQSGCGDDVQRIYRPIHRIDPRLGCALVWAEDFRFFAHRGVDWRSLANAMQTNWQVGEMRYGGSTIVMQLARNLYLERVRTPSRKAREIIVARQLSASFDRLRLLELYLNAVEWAPCVYGAEAAAQHYLGKSAALLSPAEAVFLASLVPRPSRPPGFDDADRSRLIQRQTELLTQLTRAGLLSRRVSRTAHAEVFELWNRPRSWTSSRTREGSARIGDAIGDAIGDVGKPAPRTWYARRCGGPGP